MGNLNKKKINLISVCLIFVVTVSLVLTFNFIPKNITNKKELFEISEDDSNKIKNSNGAIIGDWPSEILIDGDATGIGAHNWTWAVSQTWCSGSGTLSNPYIIDGLEMEDPNDNGGILDIRDSKVYFIIQNCKFNNSYGLYSHGIRLRYVTNGTIINTEFSSNSIGITVSNCDNLSIQGNIFTNNGAGISLSKSYNSNLTSNTINNVGTGIYISECENITLTGNSMSLCGIILGGNQNQMASNNIDISNTVNGKLLYYYTNQKGLDINKFTNAGQIILVNCSYAIINNVNVSYTANGLALYYSNNISITNNNATYCDIQGFYINYCNNVSLIGNNCSNNTNNGIKIDNSEKCNISNNYVNSNKDSGIYLSNCIENNVTNNKALNNTNIGITISSCNSLFLKDNTIIHGGIDVSGDQSQLSSHSIDDSNTVNGKWIYYRTNDKGLTPGWFTNAGQIFLIGCNDSSIENQNISFVYKGIVLRYCNNITIINCNSSNNRNGFELYESTNCTFFLTIANNNTYGYDINDCNYCNLTGNEVNFNSESGFEIYGGINNSFSYNNLFNNLEYGIYLSQGENHTFKHNSMINCGLYIYASSTIDDMVKNYIDKSNTVNNKPLFYYTHKKGLLPNDFTNAGQIILINCSYSLISNQNISSTTLGIGLYHCENNTIRSNNFTLSSQCGIKLYYSSYNNITRNQIEKNREFGIELDSASKYNNFYLNYFKQNGRHVIGGETTNKWDNSTIGNYWDDYTGKDKNDNGIGDTPYVVFSYVNIFTVYIYDNKPIWDDGAEPIIPPAADEDDDEESEEIPYIPFGHFYLIFMAISITCLIVIYKKRSLNK